MKIKTRSYNDDSIPPSSRAYKGKLCLNSVSFRARLKDANEALCLSSSCKLFDMLAPV